MNQRVTPTEKRRGRANEHVSVDGRAMSEEEETLAVGRASVDGRFVTMRLVSATAAVCDQHAGRR